MFTDITSVIIFQDYYFNSFQLVFGKNNPLNYLLLLSFSWNLFLASFPSHLYAAYGIAFKCHLKLSNQKLEHYFDKTRVQTEESIDKKEYCVSDELNVTRHDYAKFTESISYFILGQSMFRFYSSINVIFYEIINLEDDLIYCCFIIVIMSIFSLYHNGFLADSIKEEVRNFFNLYCLIFLFIYLSFFSIYISIISDYSFNTM